MKSRKAAIITSVITASVVLDQWTKVVARDYLEGEPTQSYLGDVLRLTFIENHGAFLGLGGSLPPVARTLIFTVFVSIMLVGFLWWVWRTPNLSTMTLVACALVVGGGIGNLIDRIANNGGVADFLNLGIGTCQFCRTGIFNVADLWIVIGAALLLISGDLSKKEDDPDETPPTEASSET